MVETHKGHCLCGAVQLEGHGKPTIEICHCSMCQHWHGGPAMAVMFADGTHIVSGTEHIGTYKSSEWARRSFCKRCGTTLFYQLEGTEAPHGSQAGLFDLPEGLSIHEEIFVDEQPDYYRFQTNAPRLTGQEVFERFQRQQQNQND